MENATRRREQEVWHACDDLWALNADFKVLTGDSIRERLLILGKCRGSPNEIYKYRKTWMDNRGVAKIDQNSLDDTKNDPIARAVRMVHEKLQSETDEQMQLLQEAHRAALEEKEREIAKIKADLASVMAEFSKLQDGHDVARKTHRETLEQLQAEIAIRKATEAELDKTIELGQKSLQAKALLLSELKEAHGHEIERLGYASQKMWADLAQKLANSEMVQREQGLEFSEKLTELKMANYNLEILHKRAEDQSELLAEKLVHLETARLELLEKNELLRAEAERFRFKFASSLEKIGELTRENAIKSKQNRAVKLVLKRCELKLARLRAWQNGA